MRAILTRFLALLMLSGCWTPGSVQENLPRLRDKLPLETSFYVEKTEKRVRKALSDALEARGFKVVEKKDAADVAVVTKVLSWEYNDAGFSGFRDRDEMTLSIALERVATKRILARHTISVESDFRIIAKYIDSL